MREPETIRLTLGAAETGHLVLSTMHSSTCAEALQRITASFPSEIQNAVRAQLADCLVAVVAQRLRYRQDLKIRVPELEILIPSHAVRSFIRNGDFFKISQVLETGADHGMWTFARYQNWLENRKTWHIPDASEQAEPDAIEAGAGVGVVTSPVLHSAPSAVSAPPSPAASPKSSGPIEIEPVEGGLREVLRELDR